MANEKRLIDVEQAKRATYEEIFWTESEQAAVRNFLAKLPKVDAVEVKHGRVLLGKHPTYAVLTHQCSKCRAYMLPQDNYCPDCGAKMDWVAV